MKVLLGVTLLLQGLCMLIDEFYFHYRRGLGKWERLGHPIDTLSVFLCFLFVTNAPYTLANLTNFFGLAVGSCLLITKDEWIHSKECSSGEMWLHSLLFILHPVILMLLGWSYAHFSLLDEVRLLLKLQLWILGGFIVYQLVYWNWARRGSIEWK